MLETIERYRVQIGMVLLILLFMITTIFIVYKINIGNTTYFVSMVLVEKDGCQYELKVRNKDKVTIYREGEEEEIISRIPRVAKERLGLPDFNKIEGKDTLNGRVPKREMSWELTYSDSFKYIKHLMNNGYLLKMYASTPQYVEVFLEKGGVVKRLIVFRETIMVGDLYDGTELPMVESYFEQYKQKQYEGE